MRGASYAGLGAGLALAACNSTMGPADPNQPPEAAGQPIARAPDGAGAALAGIYVARRPHSTLVGHRARFHGRFALREGCLVFEDGDAVYVPVVTRQTPVRVFADRVEIGGRTHTFDRATTLAGGATDATAAAGLDERPPARCPWPLLQVSGVR